jgi:uncharacterized membrane protein YcaP (DUF421 family)
MDMDKLFGLDLFEMFVPTHSLAEIAVRGSVMYLALVIILRFLMKRRAGSISITDLLVIVVIADAAQNAFSKEYRSITEGILLVVVIVLWDYFLDALSYRFPAVSRLLHSTPLLLVRDGKALTGNLRKESITRDELMSQLRQQGVETLDEVTKAYLEDDGQISVIKKTGDNETRKRTPKGPA